jgi:hypothetical protein
LEIRDFYRQDAKEDKGRRDFEFSGLRPWRSWRLGGEIEVGSSVKIGDWRLEIRDFYRQGAKEDKGRRDFEFSGLGPWRSWRLGGKIEAGG